MYLRITFSGNSPQRKVALLVMTHDAMTLNVGKLGGGLPSISLRGATHNAIEARGCDLLIPLILESVSVKFPSYLNFFVPTKLQIRLTTTI